MNWYVLVNISGLNSLVFRELARYARVNQIVFWWVFLQIRQTIQLNEKKRILKIKINLKTALSLKYFVIDSPE